MQPAGGWHGLQASNAGRCPPGSALLIRSDPIRSDSDPIGSASLILAPGGLQLQPMQLPSSQPQPMQLPPSQLQLPPLQPMPAPAVPPPTVQLGLSSHSNHSRVADDINQRSARASLASQPEEAPPAPPRVCTTSAAVQRMRACMARRALCGWREGAKRCASQRTLLATAAAMRCSPLLLRWRQLAAEAVRLEQLLLRCRARAASRFASRRLPPAFKWLIEWSARRRRRAMAQRRSVHRLRSVVAERWRTAALKRVRRLWLLWRRHHPSRRGRPRHTSYAPLSLARAHRESKLRRAAAFGESAAAAASRVVEARAVQQAVQPTPRCAGAPTVGLAPRCAGGATPADAHTLHETLWGWRGILQRERVRRRRRTMRVMLAEWHSGKARMGRAWERMRGAVAWQRSSAALTTAVAMLLSGRVGDPTSRALSRALTAWCGHIFFRHQHAEAPRRPLPPTRRKWPPRPAPAKHRRVRDAVHATGAEPRQPLAPRWHLSPRPPSPRVPSPPPPPPPSQLRDLLHEPHSASPALSPHAPCRGCVRTFWPEALELYVPAFGAEQPPYTYATCDGLEPQVADHFALPRIRLGVHATLLAEARGGRTCHHAKAPVHTS